MRKKHRYIYDASIVVQIVVQLFPIEHSALQLITLLLSACYHRVSYSLQVRSVVLTSISKTKGMLCFMALITAAIYLFDVE